MKHKRNKANSPELIGVRPHWPEREGIKAGTLGFGEPRWAKATSFHPYYLKPGSNKKLDRSDETKDNPRKRLPVLPPQDHSVIIAHPNREPITPNPGTKFDEQEHAIKNARTSVEISSMFERLYKKLGKRKRVIVREFGEVKEAPVNEVQDPERIVWRNESGEGCKLVYKRE